jgi:hypothetical protein
MLYASTMLFINGESYEIGKAMPRALRRLADTRQLPGRQIPAQGNVMSLLYRWYRAGYIYLAKALPTG